MEKPSCLHRKPSGAHAEQSDSRKVLVVEDEALIAMYVEDIVEQSGYDVAGVVSSLDDALAFIDDHTIDSAVLDVNLNGRPVFPLADALMERGIPFVFASSYGERNIPAAYRAGPIVQKPFAPSELRRALAQTNNATRRTSAR
jgi:CheY-like chemotaxis protein